MDAATREARTTTARRYFEKPLLVAAVLNIPTTILQFTQVSEPLHLLGEILNWLIWLAFFAELVTTLALAPDRARYLLLNPIDVGDCRFDSTVLSGGAAVQSIRALRLLRAFRLLRLAPLARIVFSLKLSAAPPCAQSASMTRGLALPCSQAVAQTSRLSGEKAVAGRKTPTPSRTPSAPPSETRTNTED